MKKSFIFVVDIITIVLILFHIQSLIALIIEDSDLLDSYNFFKYISFHDLFGILEFIFELGLRELYSMFSFIIYILNISAVIKKSKRIFKDKSFFRKHKNYLIIINLLFLFFKSIEYYIDWGYRLSV